MLQNRRKGTGTNVWPSERNIQQQPITHTGLQTVVTKVIFSRVLDIDTVAQQFEAEVYIQARWTEHQLAGLSEAELNSVDFSLCWNPKLSILNKAGQFDVEKISVLIQYEEEEIDPVVTYMWRMKGMFRENLELAHFPFDVQEMSIVLSSERPTAEIDLQPDVYNLSNVSPGALQEGHEWTMFRHIEFTKDFTTTEFINSTKHPVLVASCHARRRLGFYMWNIIVVVIIESNNRFMAAINVGIPTFRWYTKILILCLTLTVLSIDPTSTDRLTVTITLFLTAVAFKLVIKTTLPMISYLTYLDIYMVFTLMYLATQAGENAIMSHLARFRDREKVMFYDEVAQSILIGLLILFHAVFLVYIQLTAFSRRRSMYEKDHDFHIARMKEKIRRRRARKAMLTNPSFNRMDQKAKTPVFFQTPPQLGPFRQPPYKGGDPRSDSTHQSYPSSSPSEKNPLLSAPSYPEDVDDSSSVDVIM